nr:hypothetical protein [Bosea sp. LC85]
MDAIGGIGDDILRAQKPIPDGKQITVGREGLHTAVLAIGDDHAAIAENAEAMRRQERARRRADGAPARQMPPSAIEPMHERVAVAIRHVEAPVRGKGDVAGMIERRAGLMRLPDLAPHGAIPIAEQDAVGITIDNGDHAIGACRDLVRIEAEAFAPARDAVPLARENHHAGARSVDRDVGPQQHVDATFGIARNVGDLSGCLAKVAPWPLDAKAPLAQPDAQFRLHHPLETAAQPRRLVNGEPAARTGELQ